MKIAILDDYQDSVRHLPCFRLLDGLDVKIFNHSAKGLGQLTIRLADRDALVLIRERTALTRALIDKLPNLKMIVQTGRIGPHVDLAAAAARGPPMGTRPATRGAAAEPSRSPPRRPP